MELKHTFTLSMAYLPSLLHLPSLPVPHCVLSFLLSCLPASHLLLSFHSLTDMYPPLGTALCSNNQIAVILATFTLLFIFCPHYALTKCTQAFLTCRLGAGQCVRMGYVGEVHFK